MQRFSGNFLEISSYFPRMEDIKTDITFRVNINKEKIEITTFWGCSSLNYESYADKNFPRKMFSHSAEIHFP